MDGATPIIIPDNSIEVARSAAEIASDVSSAAKTALGFVKKTWIDDPESGTPITAAELNRIEDAISNLDTSIQDLQDSVSRIVTGTVTRTITQPMRGDWAYMMSILKYEETRALLGRPFDAARDQFFATNLSWNTCQVLAVPFVQTVLPSYGGSLAVAVTTPTGQGGGGQTKSLTIGWTIIKGE